MNDESLRIAVRNLIAKLPKCRECKRPATKYAMGGWGEHTGDLCDLHGRGEQDQPYAVALRAISIELEAK